jgi:hypothetical protein
MDPGLRGDDDKYSATAERAGTSTLEFDPLRCYITGMAAAWEGMRRIIGPVLG